MAERARAFAARLDPTWRPEIAYRAGGRLAGIAVFAGWLDALAPDVVYVLDMAVSGVLASAWHRGRRGPRVIVDTGDAITALARSSGDRGTVGLAATAALERFALWSADAIVVRGTFHRGLLAERGIDATFIPDGVDLTQFKPLDGTAARARIGASDAFVVGLVGSSIWSPALEMAYGWDLVELIAEVKDLPVRGLLIGDGTGVSRLRAQP